MILFAPCLAALTGTVVIAFSPFLVFCIGIYIKDTDDYKIGGGEEKHEVMTPLSLCRAYNRRYPELILDLTTLF